MARGSLARNAAEDRRLSTSRITCAFLHPRDGESLMCGGDPRDPSTLATFPPSLSHMDAESRKPQEG